MNGWIAVTACAGMYLLGWLATLWDKACERRHARRQPAEPGARPWTEPEPEPGPVLTADEILYLVELAACYPGDSKAGVKIAGHLRSKIPDIPDIIAMRYAIAFMHIARTFRRNALSSDDAFSRFIHACGGTVLELSGTERQQEPSND